MTLTMVGLMSATSLSTTQIKAKAVDPITKKEAKEVVNGDKVLIPKAGYTFLSAVKSVDKVDNIVTINYVNGEKAKLTFLDNNLFRLDMEPSGKDEDFKDYADPNSKDHTGRIVQQKDNSNEYSKPSPTITDEKDHVRITSDALTLEINKTTSMMKLSDKDGNTIWEESAPLQYKNGSTVQTLVENQNENFYGGGTQNGRFAHKGQAIQIKNTNNWVDGGVSSPNPFYWSTNGYGVIRNTFKEGEYDFGKAQKGEVVTTHSEKRFDAYFFVGSNPANILQEYYKVTGNPALFPEDSFYLGHLNCYNRDEWTPAKTGGNLLEDGKRYNEKNNGGKILNGGMLETLNGTNADDFKFSARAVINGHIDNDMPFGWFLPNDGYGCGYGQSDTSIDDNINNLKAFTDYANARGVTTGLWTQSALTPDPSQPIHLQRDFEKEVKQGGVRTLKTDVAWVGSGYSFGLNGIRKAYDIIAETKDRPTVITLDGWAGTQRYGGIWTGDQTGGNWEYIRFHIPTYIGQSLSGNPNVSSDVDGIFGGSSLIQTRDFQWKSFTSMMLDMDGWGSYPKKPYIFGEDTTSINRMYLKLRAELMPYIYSTAYTSANLGTGDEKGKPQVRAMFLEYPNDPATYGKNVEYQYMFGKNLLVAPIYQNTDAKENGDDIRNGIYLPDDDQIWIDYFTGKQYQGGRTLNNFDAPIWKLPLFVKNGAILPRYAENNNAAPITDTNKKGLDKTKRIIEFYPDAAKKKGTDYTLYEDDGKSIDNTNESQPIYGSVVTTNFTSIVNGDTAVLTADKSSGNYTGYDANRETTFIVNVSKEPTDITATIGSTTLSKGDFKVVHSQDEFDKAAGNVYYYNQTPNLNQFATKGSEFAKKEITTTPKLYVKMAKTDVNQNAVQVILKGFSNDGELNKNEQNTALKAPANLHADKEHTTPTMIPLQWDPAAGATSYELETDGVIQSGITKEQFNHTDLAYNSTHTYRIRAVNADGYSVWSDVVTAQSAQDPYRNVPKDIALKWNYGDSWGALKNALDFDYNTYFHSTNDDAIGKDFIMDMKKVYDMDKFEYTPRQDNKGNGTVQQMDIYASIDGKKYTLVHDGAKDEWTYTNDDSRDTKTVSLNGVKARYLKLVVRKSKGNFFSAAELQPYFKEGTTSIVPGDTNNDGIVDEKDLVQIDNYVGLEKGDATWEQVEKSDWNGNGYYDAQDIAYTTTLINGGIKKTDGDPQGGIQFIPNKTSVKKGEKVVVNLYGVNMKNVYAAGFKIPYDNTKLTYESVQPSLASVRMKQFAFDRLKVTTNKDVPYTRNMNLVFSDLGDQTSINGTQSLGSVTFTAAQDMEINDDTFKDAEAILVSNNLNAIDAEQTPVEPALPDVEHKLTSDDMSVKGQDETVLQANMGVDKLIDGKIGSDANRFEFKWGNSEQEVPARLPYDITFTFNKPTKISKMKISVRHDGAVLNTGALKDFDLIGIREDGTQEKIESDTITKSESTFMEHNNKTYKGIILRAKTSQGGLIYKLNIDEVEFYDSSEKKVTGIVLSKDNPKELYVGRIAGFSATVTPDDASNPYYDVTSSDPSIVEVIKSSTGNGYKYALQGKKAGTAKISVTTKGLQEDGNKAKAETEITVSDGFYTKDLQTLVDAASEKIKEEQLYTDATLQNVKKEIEKAKSILFSPSSQEEIDHAGIDLEKAVIALAFKGSIESQPDSTAEITNPNVKLVSASSAAAESPAANTIDGDESTFWHSNYNAGYALPQDVVIDLGGEYDLQQINYLPRQDGSHNGDIIRYCIEVSDDGKTFKPIVVGTFDNDGNEILNRDEYKKIKFASTKARYVKFIALNALGDAKDTYASAAELKFFGKKEGTSVPATSIVVDQSELQDMQPGQKVTINATVNPANTTDELTWASDNELVATVNARGEITAVSGGDATITVTANVNVKATVKVHVKDANKENLQTLIDEAKSITYSNQAIQDALNTAIQTAEKALQGSQEDQKNAYLVLATTMSEVALIDKDVTAIQAYANVDLHTFEAGEDADMYKTLVDNAMVLCENPMKYGKELSEARKKLDEAYHKLVKLKLEQLAEALKIVKNVNVDEYVDGDAKTSFLAAIKEAEGLKPTSNAQIKDMIDTLSQSYKALKLKITSVQVQAITDLVTQIRALDFSKYTQVNQEKLKNGIKEAETALKNKNLSSEEANTIIDQLHALLLLDEVHTGGDTDDNTTGGNPGNTPTPPKDQNTVTVNPTNPVDTSDHTQFIAWFSLIGLSGIGSWIIARKRKKADKS